MRLKLQKLQEVKSKAQELKQQKINGYEDINEIFYYWGLQFILKAISMELISCYYNNLLANHFGIKKTCELLV